MNAARHCLLFAAFVVIAAAVAGCTSSQKWTMSRLWSNPSYDDGTDKVEEWVEEAGSEARGNREMEKQVDPLGLRDVFMSEKARSIERNLGIE